MSINIIYSKDKNKGAAWNGKQLINIRPIEEIQKILELNR